MPRNRPVDATRAVRQARFKAKHGTVSISVRRATAARIRSLRTMSSMTTDQLLLGALALMEISLNPGTGTVQKGSGKASSRTTKTPLAETKTWPAAGPADAGRTVTG
jgi:hypothetical protein